MILITIPISHYCERARWALQICDLHYQEQQHIQCFAWPYAIKAGGRKTVPVLVIPGGKPLTDSSEIVEFAHLNSRSKSSLYPDDKNLIKKVKQLENRFAGELGVEARRLMYWHFFNMGKKMLPFNGAQAPKWERATMSFAFPVLTPLLKNYLGVSNESAQKALQTVTKIFDDVAKKLERNGTFLVGNSFTAADLTFACMSAAVILPNQYGVTLPDLCDISEETATMVKKFRQHPAGQFALKMFSEHHYTSNRPTT